MGMWHCYLGDTAKAALELMYDDKKKEVNLFVVKEKKRVGKLKMEPLR
jgi:hypothetical protein